MTTIVMNIANNGKHINNIFSHEIRNGSKQLMTHITTWNYKSLRHDHTMVMNQNILNCYICNSKLTHVHVVSFIFYDINTVHVLT